MIPYGRHQVIQPDIDAVIDVLKSDFLTQGPAVPAFESAVMAYCGADHAIAVNSATSALHLACLALGVGKGDWVWTSPISFVASSNCALYCGASVDFVDIDPLSYNMSIDRLAEKLFRAREARRLPKVVIPVHLCGQPCNMEAIQSLASEYGFHVIEDASHAIGAKYRSNPVGNCKYSDITVFSFHPVKIVTTGEGGMAITKHRKLAERMALLRNHGITRDPAMMTHAPDGEWYYQQIDLGFNYRMTDIQAALGVSQLARLDEYVSRRLQIAAHYDQLLKDMPVVLPWRDSLDRSSMHLYVIRLMLDRIKKSHKTVFSELRMHGVGVNLHYIPIHTQPYYSALKMVNGNFPEAERYYASAISLPMFPSMSDQDQLTVVAGLRQVLIG